MDFLNSNLSEIYAHIKIFHILIILIIFFVFIISIGIYRHISYKKYKQKSFLKD